MADASYGSLPFKEQIAFFKRKLNIPTTGWTDIYTHEHDYAFMVAGANRDAIVADFRTAVEKAIAEGMTLQDFRENHFDRIVAQHGWDYNGGRNWRSKIIYDTNLATSYAAGRWEQLQDAPYWQYKHADWVQHPREDHLAWDGLVLARDDPWWYTHFPPNGWRCQCSVRGLWPRDLQRLGKTGPDTAPDVQWEERTIGQRNPNGPRTVRVPAGIDPGFEYAPGRSRLQSAIPPERPVPPVSGSAGGHGLPNRRPGADEALPAPRLVSAAVLLAQGLEPQAYAQAFLTHFDADLEQPAIFEDVIGERVVVGKELFQKPDGQWKADKQERGSFMPLLAQALRDPDEVWVRLEWMYALQKAVVRRRYIARFEIEGQPMPALIVFDRDADSWSGVTTFQGTSQRPEDWRVGVRLYQRK